MNPIQSEPPVSSDEVGAPGELVRTREIATNFNQDFFRGMGIDNSGASPRYLGVDIPVVPVDWDWLRFLNWWESGNPLYDPSNYSGDPDPQTSATNAYIMDVLKSVIMALLVAYILLNMLEVLPFLASGLSMGSGGVGESGLDAKTLAGGKLGPPGSDTLKNEKK
jgi:hypothetical protein